MSILGPNGKNASAGPPVLYHLTESGKILYSEHVEEKADSFIFDGEKTVMMGIVSQKGNQAQLQMQKLSEAGFQTRYIRVMKTTVQMVTDCGDPKIHELAQQAMSGLVLPGGAVN